MDLSHIRQFIPLPYEEARAAQVDLGGLGTLIASMASLISYREIARELPLQKGRYFALFTVSNILFVTVLMGAWALAG